ncbi:MAG: RsmE family RNA methyltransferase [Opitutales bacterium]|nr:RsmE family RNA methyltransferase [Opitutales bacterium]
MNLLLLDQQVSFLHLDKTDPRSRHLERVLKVKPGDCIDLAVQNGPKGKGRVTDAKNGSFTLEIEWLPLHAPDFYPISLVVGLARPQTCRKVLDQAASLGVRSFTFFGADKGEISYRQSNLWRGDEWKRKIQEGVAQAFASSIPTCSLLTNLDEALEKEKPAFGIALDNYEASQPLSVAKREEEKEYVLCVGPERGWSDRERKLLRKYQYELFHLGPRVLRVETAVVAALGMITEPFWG